MQTKTLAAVLIALACAVLLGVAVAGIVAFHELASVSGDLERVSADMDAVAGNIKQVSKEMSAMNGKLSKTNGLLLRTNASLGTMIAQARTSDAKLARMQDDLSVMSHKISGSFLFRGVK